MLAKEPGDELVNDGVAKRVKEVVALFNESPEPLIGTIGPSVDLNNCSGAHGQLVNNSDESCQKPRGLLTSCFAPASRLFGDRWTVESN